MNRALETLRVLIRPTVAQHVARIADLVAETRLTNRLRCGLRFACGARIGLTVLARETIEITRQRVHAFFHAHLALVKATLPLGAIGTGTTKLFDITLHTTLLLGQRAGTSRGVTEAGASRLVA